MNDYKAKLLLASIADDLTVKREIDRGLSNINNVLQPLYKYIWNTLDGGSKMDGIYIKRIINDTIMLINKANGYGKYGEYYDMVKVLTNVIVDVDQFLYAQKKYDQFLRESMSILSKKIKKLKSY